VVKSQDFRCGLEECGPPFKVEDGFFIIDQGRKMDASLKAIKAFIASCTELFSVTV
jgi:hypothetical protein